MGFRLFVSFVLSFAFPFIIYFVLLLFLILFPLLLLLLFDLFLVRLKIYDILLFDLVLLLQELGKSFRHIALDLNFVVVYIIAGAGKLLATLLSKVLCIDP